MGALVTVMVSPRLADGCDVAKDAVAALVADGWTPPLLAAALAVQPLEAGPLQKSITEGTTGGGVSYKLPASRPHEEPVLHAARMAGPSMPWWRTLPRRFRVALGIPND